MKPKTIYMLMIICSMSLLSSAKQSGKYCDKTCTGFTKQKCTEQAKPKAAKEAASYDLPPLQLLTYGI